MLEGNYDVVLADIRLPDMTGYELLLKLQEIMDPVPLVLMVDFGYDPFHTIPNARKMKLPLYGELSKPFRLDQLLDTVERIVLQRRQLDKQRAARADQDGDDNREDGGCSEAHDSDDSEAGDSDESDEAEPAETPEPVEQK